MSGLLLRLFPRAWRAAYGAEVADMLARSRRPWRDRADLLRAAVEARGDRVDELLEERMDTLRNLRIVAAGLVALGLAGGVWATGQLRDGVLEIPLHWWSTLAVLPLLAGIALGAVAWWPRRRSRA
jgi:hypothetical protein